MGKIKTLKIKQSNGSFGAAIAIGADAINVDLSDGSNLQEKVTKIESDFNNYYNKKQVDSMIEAITTLDIQIVSELPTESISTTTIYLKLNKTQAQQNVYDEYIYVNGKWELIGSTAVDLSDYYNKSEIDGKLKTKQNTLVSGTNIKTINGETLLGKGDIVLTTEEKEISINATQPQDEKNKIWINPEEETEMLELAPVAFSGNYEDLNGIPSNARGSVTVIDNLNSTDGTAALSANQGKVLNDKITTIDNSKIGSLSVDKVEIVTEYPAKMEENVLYFKVMS